MFSTMNSMVFVKTSLLLMLSTLLLKVYLIENVKTLIESPLDNNCNYSCNFTYTAFRFMEVTQSSDALKYFFIPKTISSSNQ